MKAGPGSGLRLRAGVLAAGLAVLGASFVQVPVVAAQQNPPGCPQVMPVDQLQAGQTGYGLTVSKGTTPEQFTVEVLGVLEDGIGPGRDMIIVDTASPAIEKAKGIWFGMSGSPVYVQNKLIGAVAFGLGFGPSSIAGLTPAQDMLDILAYPNSSESTMAPRAALSPSMKRAIARSENTSASEVPNNMSRLMIPLSVSGASGRAMKHIREAVQREGLAFIPHAGSAAPGASEPAGSDPVPGGNFVAALSYGDVTFAGIGTTTVVCDGRALAFGHPFQFDGETSMGANAAEAITIVDDPVFGSFKLANVRGTYGTLDQDRLAGIRAELGPGPEVIPLTSSVFSKGNLRTRAGETDSVESEFVPFLTFIHMFSNIDVTLDRIGEGSSALDWTITGVTESGESFELNRSNLYASEYDISFESLFELEGQLYQLYYNDFESIEFTGVHVDAEVEDDVKQYTITDIDTAVNGGAFREGRRVNVNRGDNLTLRVTLQPYDESGDRTVDMQVRVPNRARRDGNVTVTGGSDGYYYDFYCFEFGEDCTDEAGNKIESVSDLVASLENRPTNNQLLAKLRMGGRRVKSSDAETLDQVVSGYRFLRLNLKGGCCSGVAEGKG